MPDVPGPAVPRGRGRPAFTPSAGQRKIVTVLRATGIAIDDIARQLGVSRSTLYRCCKPELDQGKSTIIARLGALVVTKALKGDAACIQLFLKTHGGPGWRDGVRLEHTGADGSALAPPNLVVSFLQPKPDAPG